MDKSLHFTQFGSFQLAMEDIGKASDSSLSSDQILMLEIATGNQVSMGQLIDQWKDSVFRFFDRSLHNKADAEDLTQRVFIKLYHSAPKYQPKAKFSTYLFTIARNLLIDEINKNNRKQTVSFEEEWIKNEVNESSEGVSEIYEIIEFAMRGMPEFQCTALLLRVQKELSYSEIADIMKVSESRVKTWIHRARLFLKKSLEESEV
jgi:RNA polymerase sigma-70 factor (ECF subfamily)